MVGAGDANVGHREAELEAVAAAWAAGEGGDERAEETLAQRQELGVPPSDGHLGERLVRDVGPGDHQQRERPLHGSERLPRFPEVEQLRRRRHVQPATLP